MENIFKIVKKWQDDAGLSAKAHNPLVEGSFVLEESLELLRLKDIQLYTKSGELVFNTSDESPIGLYNKDGEEVFRLTKDMSPKDLSRAIMFTLFDNKDVSEVEKFDAAIDIIVFTIGAMSKLGLTPQQMVKGITVVNNANKQKLGQGQDEHGKNKKPEDFVGPEIELQKIMLGK